MRYRFGVELAEECCFECKDGGEDLITCEYMNCLKSYHPLCTVRKEGQNFPPGEKFICNWHICVNCSKSADYHCLCCPNYSVCCNCLRNVEFSKMGKQNKGLCCNCLVLAITIEKNAVDPRAKSNYQDSDVGLLLFKDYWDIIKDTEHLTLVDLQVASGLINRGLNCTCEADSEPDEDNKTDEDLLGYSGDNEQTYPSGLKSKPEKMRWLASFNQHNINLIYLRRKLVAELLKHEDTFEQKVVGCSVRVMHSARSHFFSKSTRPFHLGLVSGIKESQEEYKINDTTTKVLLCVAGFWGDVKITMLSEENIQEEECNDLIPLVEKGIVKRITVAEFQEKVAAVHTDIVNHWIDTKLKRLEHEIDIANEKGWHRELGELINQKKLLSTPAERQRLLEEVPEIVADAEDEKETGLAITAGNSCQVNREATPPAVDSFNVLKENPQKGVAEYASGSSEVLKEKPPEGATEQAVNAFNILNEETSKGAADRVADSLRVREEVSPEGASKKMAHSYLSNVNEESSEAGEAFSSGVTPAPVLHSPVAQGLLLNPFADTIKNSSKTQAIDIDKDESNHTKHNKSNVSSGTPTELTGDQARVGVRHDDVQAERDDGSSNRPSRFKRPSVRVSGPEWAK